MTKSKLKPVPFGQFTSEMRSGKIISLGEGFTDLMGYTDEDLQEGLLFKQFFPDVEYDKIVQLLREQFIETSMASYLMDMVTKDGVIKHVVTFFTIQNKLLDGHRVLEVGIADITKMEEIQK